MNKEISVGLNITRIVACFFVILLHTSAMGLYKTNYYWEQLNIIDSMTRVCVPLFIMLSGALLIREKPDSKTKIAKRIIIIMACLFFWSIVYIWRDKNAALSLGMLFDSIEGILSGPVKYHLWYLYFIVGAYVAIPFLSKAYHNSSLKSSISYLFIWFLLCTFMTFKNMIGVYNNYVQTFNLSYLADVMGYLILGRLIFDFVCKNESKIKSLPFIVAFFLSVAATSLFVYFMSIKSENIDQSLYSYTSPFVIIGASSIFILFLKNGNILSRFESQLSKVSQLTLGVYCMHLLFVDYFYTMFIYWWGYKMNSIYVLLSSVATFVICLLVSFIIKKTKILSFAV
ncbi:TPA: acyltransferase family protein [Citrobacter freundii]|uniref:acyltransferase n=1 Tax=Citrobacter freundii TaxID=546 RepID=UPI0029243EA1|nr:acyltransferase family protein [Citrobacter freundii]WMY42659.1 acyltransferase family protein [Citrobacter freundii]HCJ7746508.1 acyltransferase family protein [Citrobacter freundii]